MCFGSHPSQPKAPPIPQVQVQQPASVAQSTPSIISGADQGGSKKKINNKSIFQIDLSVPATGGVGANPGGSQVGQANPQA